MNGSLTDIEGLLVGHAHDLEAGLTGCTVILCPPETVGGVDQRGGAPGTRETDVLRPLHLVQHVDAIFLAGGSAFGLAAGDGVMRYLEEQGRGYPTSGGRVPIVAGAIVFDLDMGSGRPDAPMGYAACQAATGEAVQQGCVGAGTGATIGKLMGKDFAIKGGIGSASLDLGEGLMVAALFVVNAVGEVLAEDGSILGGIRQPEGKGFLPSLEVLRQIAPHPPSSNTVIGVVATNARLTKEEANLMAQMAHDGLARAVRPAHTLYDGDTIFGLATGTHTGNPAVIGAFAAEVTAQAIRSAIRSATSLGGIPSIQDL